MEAVVKRKVTAEFRVEAVKLVNEQGFTQADVARRLNAPYQTLCNWVQLAKAGKLATVVKGAVVDFFTPLRTVPLRVLRSALRRNLDIPNLT